MAKAPAKKTTKAAPQAEAQIEVGSHVRFLGYDENVPEEERFLTEGEVYEVVDFTDADEDADAAPVVRIPNPDFNAKKKEHPDTNPKTMDVEVFPEEIELVADGEGAEEAAEDAAEEVEEGAEEGAEEAAAVAEAAVSKAKGKAAAKTPAKAAGKTAAKTAAKAEQTPAKAGKAAAPAKTAAKKKAEVVETENGDSDVPELEHEDPEILALVESNEDLIALAQDLEGQVATTEYQLGGVLYHIKKNKPYLELEVGEGEEGYDGPGGFRNFIKTWLNVDYRKAMYLIDIYVAFSQAQIENPSEVVARLGWTKASKIARPMMEEGANIDDLIELAAENTVADLSTALTEQVSVGGAKQAGEKVSRTTLKFRLFEEEAATVQQILATAKEVYGVEDIADALVQMAAEWSSMHAAESAAEEQVTPKQSATATKPAAKRKATAKA